MSRPCLAELPEFRQETRAYIGGSPPLDRRPNTLENFTPSVIVDWIDRAAADLSQWTDSRGGAVLPRDYNRFLRLQCPVSRRYMQMAVRWPCSGGSTDPHLFIQAVCALADEPMPPTSVATIPPISTERLGRLLSAWTGIVGVQQLYATYHPGEGPGCRGSDGGDGGDGGDGDDDDDDDDDESVDPAVGLFRIHKSGGLVSIASLLKFGGSDDDRSSAAIVAGRLAEAWCAYVAKGRMSATDYGGQV